MWSGRVAATGPNGAARPQEGRSDDLTAMPVQVALAVLEQPLELIAAIELDHRPLQGGQIRDVIGRDRHRLDAVVQRLPRSDPRLAGQAGDREAGDGAGLVVASLGSDIRGRDDDAHLAASIGKGPVEERPADASRLVLGMNEELGQLEQSAALERAGIADDLAGPVVLGHPPLGGMRRQEVEERLLVVPDLVGIRVPRRALARGQLAHGRDEDVEARAFVVRRGRTHVKAGWHRHGA